ncbi:MAG: sensor histidine kinase [Oscillochloris sp.]|nr:sensor histidine kinase [Oscillochloris sp.]
MLHSISAFFDRLRSAHPTAPGGVYTPTTIARLAQSLSGLIFKNGGVLFVSNNASQRSWGALALRGINAAVRQQPITIAEKFGSGLVLIGVGAQHGFAITMLPGELEAPDESVQFHDVVWSCQPEAVLALLNFSNSILPEPLPPDRLQPLTPEALLRLSSDLLDFTARQHSTLTVTNRALSERLRNQEDQTRMIIHDMRAPLHTLLISIKALQRQHFDPEGQRELLGVAQDSTTYLLNLTETILDSARLETSGWSLKRQPVRLSTIVQAVCEPLELAARPDQARLRHYVPDDLPVAWLDRGLMERVLTNLITNAIKYTPASGEILVSAELAHDGHEITLQVRDTGQGIAPEAQQHIFERFFQANESDRRHGTGLGLYFCRLAVEAHGGSIAVESSVGEGSIFTILLPLNGEESETPA